MLTLAWYGNKLPGNEPPLTDKQIKKCIFQSFPAMWQQQYIRSGQHVVTASLLDIIEFMSNKKKGHTRRQLRQEKGFCAQTSQWGVEQETQISLG